MPFCFHTRSLLLAIFSPSYAAFSRARFRDAVEVIVFVHFSFPPFSSARFFSFLSCCSRRVASFSACFCSALAVRAIAFLRPASTIDIDRAAAGFLRLFF